MSATINGRPTTPEEMEQIRRMQARQSYFHYRVAEIAAERVDGVVFRDGDDRLRGFIAATIDAIPTVRAEMDSLALMAESRREH